MIIDLLQFYPRVLNVGKFKYGLSILIPPNNHLAWLCSSYQGLFSFITSECSNCSFV